METTAPVLHRIEVEEDGHWVEWFVSADEARVDREWAILQHLRVTSPLRRVQVQIIKSMGS